MGRLVSIVLQTRSFFSDIVAMWGVDLSDGHVREHKTEDDG